VPDFTVHRAEIRDGQRLAYVREGAGGRPLILLHGWPETKRIWWRNIAPLAAAGFEVIVPDLRGFGDSDLPPDGLYDTVSSARDVHALVHDVIGHAHCAGAGGDFGGVVLQELSLRFEGFVGKLCLFNTIPPILERFELAPEVRMAADYFRRQGREADALAAELRTPEERRRYIATFYGPRFWASPGTFTPDDVAFMTEPFADAEKLRASFGLYEHATGTKQAPEAPRLFEPNPTETLVLYGPEDHVIPRDNAERMQAAFPNVVGPFVVPRAGHFLQWERADLLNRALGAFLL
jgi:pimeloyl-ACP methyl ester carboxylesterase